MENLNILITAIAVKTVNSKKHSKYIHCSRIHHLLTYFHHYIANTDKTNVFNIIQSPV